MNRFNGVALKIIVQKLTEKFDRKLTFKEMRSIWMVRSAKTYESIIDYITDTNHSVADVEQFVKDIVAHYTKAA